MSITTDVYRQIKEDIQTGKYPPATTLLEQDMATNFNVSRSVIRKVFTLLESDGLVITEPHKGTKVRSYSLQEVLDFLDLRAALEGFAISRAVPLISEEEIDKLEDIIQLMEMYCKENELLLYSSQNQKFHAIILDACPNKMAVSVITNLKTRMAKYNSKTILIPGRITASFNEHTEIFTAIKHRDSEQAALKTQEHINNVKHIFEQYFALLM